MNNEIFELGLLSFEDNDLGYSAVDLSVGLTDGADGNSVCSNNNCNGCGAGTNTSCGK